MWRRKPRSSAGESSPRSWPSKKTLPAVGSISRNIRRPSVDFPDPDSPTTPNTSPGARSKDTLWTARTARDAGARKPLARPKSLVRPSDLTRGREAAAGTSRWASAVILEPVRQVFMEFHRARTARMAGAAAQAMPKHRQAGATNEAGRSSAAGGGLGPATRGAEGLGRRSDYGRRPFRRARGALPGRRGSTRPKAMKPHENLPDRLLDLAPAKAARHVTRGNVVENRHGRGADRLGEAAPGMESAAH